MIISYRKADILKRIKQQSEPSLYDEVMVHPFVFTKKQREFNATITSIENGIYVITDEDGNDFTLRREQFDVLNPTPIKIGQKVMVKKVLDENWQIKNLPQPYYGTVVFMNIDAGGDRYYQVKTNYDTELTTQLEYMEPIDSLPDAGPDLNGASIIGSSVEVHDPPDDDDYGYAQAFRGRIISYDAASDMYEVEDQEEYTYTLSRD